MSGLESSPGPLQVDASVREPAAARPRLRPGLRARLHEFSGERCVVVEDPLTGRFHRLGLPEWLLASSLDGRGTFSEAHARASAASGPDALNEGEALALLAWLIENGLADFGAVPAALIAEQRAERRRGKLRGLLNVLYLRLPLGNPSRLLDAACRRLGFLLSAPAFGVWCAAVAAGLLSLAWNRDRFAAMAEGVLTNGNGFWLAVAWIGLKIVHEMGHGMASTRYGCPVREAGICLILFLPVTYVDATASWSLADKWKRIHVAAAGMWGELFVAAVAALVWSFTAPGLVNTLASDVVWMAGVGTVLFNANPLMRFDGYYILADWCELPNMAARAQAFLARLARRWLLGLPAAPAGTTAREAAWLGVYGVASFLWRVTVIVSLFFAAASLFKGGGLVLVFVALGAWVFPFAARAVAGWKEARVSPWRAVPRLLAAAAVAAAVALVPVHPRVTAPALLQAAHLAIVRAECPGFVNRVLVSEGDAVTAGQPLVELRNLEEETALEKQRLQVQAQEQKARKALDGGDIPAFQAESAGLDGLRTQLAKVEAHVATLDVRAPVDGTVIGWRLAERVGTFVRQGDEIVRVGVLPASELKIAVGEADIDAFRAQQGHAVRVLVDGNGAVRSAVLAQVTARASAEVLHPELTSLAGGPLAVLRRQDKGDKNSQQSSGVAGDYQLLDPAFEATAVMDGPPFDGSTRAELRSGERAFVKFRSRDGVPLWKRGYAAVDRFLDRVLRRSRHAAESNSLF